MEQRPDRDRDPWAAFEHDPRRAENAGLRASDRDRAAAADVLGRAYAEGRLDPEEHDERGSAVASSRTLGELVPLLSDVIPQAGAGAVVRAGDPAAIRRRAEEKYLAQRRNALFGFLTPTVICWVVWSITMFGGFPWPAIVTVATLFPYLRVLTSRDEHVSEEVRRLEKKAERQARWQIEPPRGDT